MGGWGRVVGGGVEVGREPVFDMLIFDMDVLQAL